MAVSIALLGFGATGTFLALTQRRLKPRFTVVFAASATLFAVSAIPGFALAERLPFIALEVVWRRGQLQYLIVMYLLLAAALTCTGRRGRKRFAAAIGVRLEGPFE